MEKYKNKEWLRNELKTKNVPQIASELGCGEMTIYRWVKKLGLKREQPKYESKSWLQNQLLHKKAEDIAFECNVSSATISRWISKFGLDSRDKPYQHKEWLSEQLLLHNGSIQEVAKANGYKPDTVADWCVKFGFNKSERAKRFCKLQESFFEKIDTPQKTYALGLLMADGCMHKSMNNFSLQLRSIDEELVIWLRDILGSTAKIRHIDEYTDNNGTHHNASTGITICSSKMCKDLAYHGIGPNKTGREVLPNTIPEEFIPKFILGFLDGDGHIGKSSLLVDFCSKSLNILYSIKAYCENNLQADIYPVKSEVDHRTGNTLYHYILYSNSAMKLMDAMYNDADICLKRKRDSYLSQKKCPAEQRCSGNN